jgi:hypothetical protein
MYLSVNPVVHSGNITLDDAHRSMTGGRTVVPPVVLPRTATLLDSCIERPAETGIALSVPVAGVHNISADTAAAPERPLPDLLNNADVIAASNSDLAVKHGSKRLISGQPVNCSDDYHSSEQSDLKRSKYDENVPGDSEIVVQDGKYMYPIHISHA